MDDVRCILYPTIAAHHSIACGFRQFLRPFCEHVSVFLWYDTALADGKACTDTKRPTVARPRAHTENDGYSITF